MKIQNNWKWYLIIFQFVGIAFCVFTLHVSNKWIRDQKKLVADTADRLNKFRNVYVSADAERKTILVNKTVEFVIAENKSVADTNTFALLATQDALEAVISLNILGICLIFLDLKRKTKI